MAIPPGVAALTGGRCYACLSGSFAAAGVEEEGSFAVEDLAGVTWVCREVGEDWRGCWGRCCRPTDLNKSNPLSVIFLQGAY